MSLEFKADQKFDPDKARQIINGEVSVYHCHHYSTLFSQLADDAKLLQGPKLLAEAAEESMYPVLVKYFADNGIKTQEDKKAIAEDYYAFLGMGKVAITEISDNGGKAVMEHSHVDEGWLKKWDKRDKPVNFIGQGFLAAAFAAITDSKTGTFKVTETESIVCGSSNSKFEIRK